VNKVEGITFKVKEILERMKTAVAEKVQAS
jgi:hypothetical protein